MTITPMVPCYMKPSGCTRWQSLRFGSSTPIKPGDVCSLLPDKCWFKIISVPETMEKNDQTLKRKANEDSNDIVDGKKACLSFNTEAVTSAAETLNDFLNDKDSLTECPTPVINGNEHGDMAVPVLQEIYSTSYPEGSDVSASCSKISSDLPDTAEASVERKSNAKQERRNDDSTNEVATNIESEIATCDLDAHLSDQEAIIEAAAPMRDESRSPVARRNEASNSNRENDDVPKRERCMFGTRCYRKNPNHKNNYSHPGDADYDDRVVDDREECPYGTKCYRKNPQHKAQFKHTSVPRRRRKAANFVQPAVVDTETDASSMESVDESDYEPSVYTESSDTKSDSGDSRSEWEDGTTG